jgi:hypothetical protein
MSTRRTIETFAAGAYLPDEGFAEVFTAHDNRHAARVHQ